MKRKKFTKTALIISAVLIVSSFLLGTSSTIAWFYDEDEVINSFYYGDLDVEFYYKNESGSYELVDSSVKLFEAEDIYEPGYTQVIYFKVKNAGTVDFDYKFTVVPAEYVDGRTASGAVVHLPDYLKFGVVFGETEEEVLEKTADRKTAQSYAQTKLCDYSKKSYALEPEDEEYAAIIIYMPWQTGNEANYRGETVPQVELGASIVATQAGKLD